MPKIVVAMYGETLHDAACAVPKDAPLNSQGHEQAAFLGVQLKHCEDLNIQTIVCSDARRTMQTALIVAAVLQLPVSAVLREPRLRECDFGRLTGKIVGAPDTDFTYRDHGGEDRLDVLSRMLMALMDYLPPDDDRKAQVLYIGHRCSLGTLLHHLKQPCHLEHCEYRLLSL